MDHFDWKQLFNPEFYILLEVGGIKIGLYVVLFIVFAETGLLAGFFLPGDSLLFLCGIYSELLMRDFSTGSDFPHPLVCRQHTFLCRNIGEKVSLYCSFIYTSVCEE